jgi:anti-anti-sigma factor
MQARIGHLQNVTLVYLDGRLDMETAKLFRDRCLNYLRDKKVVFDFSKLSFVGSTGILPFLDIMLTFAQTNEQGLYFSGVGVEFKRVLEATSLSVIPVFETAEVAALQLEQAAAARSLSGSATGLSFYETESVATEDSIEVSEALDSI